MQDGSGFVGRLPATDDARRSYTTNTLAPRRGTMDRMRVMKPRGHGSVRDTLRAAARDFEKATGAKATHVCVPSNDWRGRVRRAADELGLEVEVDLKAAPGFLYLRVGGTPEEETDG